MKRVYCAKVYFVVKASQHKRYRQSFMAKMKIKSKYSCLFNPNIRALRICEILQKSCFSLAGVHFCGAQGIKLDIKVALASTSHNWHCC